MPLLCNSDLIDSNKMCQTWLSCLQADNILVPTDLRNDAGETQKEAGSTKGKGAQGRQACQEAQGGEACQEGAQGQGREACQEGAQEEGSQCTQEEFVSLHVLLQCRKT